MDPEKFHGCWNGKGSDGTPPLPGCSRSAGDCCYNYWWRNDSAPHGVSNLSHPVPEDYASYLADSFTRFLERRAASGNKPFLANLAYHNNHIPYVATNASRGACSAGKSCRASSPSAGNKAADFNGAQLDFCKPAFLSTPPCPCKIYTVFVWRILQGGKHRRFRRRAE